MELNFQCKRIMVYRNQIIEEIKLKIIQVHCSTDEISTFEIFYNTFFVSIAIYSSSINS